MTEENKEEGKCDEVIHRLISRGKIVVCIGINEKAHEGLPSYDTVMLCVSDLSHMKEGDTADIHDDALSRLAMAMTPREAIELAGSLLHAGTSSKEFEEQFPTVDIIMKKEEEKP